MVGFVIFTDHLRDLSVTGPDDIMGRHSRPGISEPGNGTGIRTLNRMNRDVFDFRTSTSTAVITAVGGIPDRSKIRGLGSGCCTVGATGTRSGIGRTFYIPDSLIGNRNAWRAKDFIIFCAKDLIEIESTPCPESRIIMRCFHLLEYHVVLLIKGKLTGFIRRSGDFAQFGNDRTMRFYRTRGHSLIDLQDRIGLGIGQDIDSWARDNIFFAISRQLCNRFEAILKIPFPIFHQPHDTVVKRQFLATLGRSKVSDSCISPGYGLQ